MDFFEIQNNMPIINPVARTIEPFKKIITRDRDRTKKQAIKELAYIYYTHDYLSPYYNYNADEREAILRDNLGMPKDWKIDEDMQKALDTYASLREATDLKFLREAIETLHASSSTLALLRQQLEASVRTLQNTKPMEVRDRDEFPDGEEGKIRYEDHIETVLLNNRNRQEMTTGAVKSVQELLVLTKNIPATIKTLQELEQKIKKELSMDARIRGGGEVGSYED